MFGIFDSRPKHCDSVYIFQDERTYTMTKALYEDKAEAERIAALMNANTHLTTYIVKEV
jgi:hypothetical protein